MKYSDGALNGEVGLNDYYHDFCDFAIGAINLQNLKAEALDIFEQKRKLGLITGLTKNNNTLIHLDDTVDFIILAANHDPQKTNFLAGLNYIRQKYLDALLIYMQRFVKVVIWGMGCIRKR